MAHERLVAAGRAIFLKVSICASGFGDERTEFVTLLKRYPDPSCCFDICQRHCVQSSHRRHKTGRGVVPLDAYFHGKPDD